MVKLYIINLDRDVKRWKNIQAQLPMFESTNFFPERVSAVLGKNLDLDKLNISIRTKACMDEPRCGHESINTLSEIGCYLSHYNAWKKFIDTSDEYCIICEDDIVFDKKILDIDKLYRRVKSFAQNSNAINPPVTIFISTLSIFYDKKSIDDLPELWRTTGRFFGTACYLINRPMAHILIKNAFPMEVQVDSYVAFLAKLNKNLHMYHIREPYASLTGENSSIGHTDCRGCFLPVQKHVVVYSGLAITALALILLIITVIKKR